ncbi:MAG: RagB/SusD family nutrient uptake outer membrane protein [Bacteroidota bacterium]
MKRIIYNSILILSFIIVCTSCKKEWLEPDPLSFYAPENVYVDQAGFEAALVMLRKDLLHECTGMWNPFSTEYMYSDLATAQAQCDFRKNTPSMSKRLPLLKFFDKAYEFIKNANVIISRIDDIEWSNEEDRNGILSEALFFRSYWYYRLVHTYGDVPWIGKELSGGKYDFNTTSRWTILEKIQKDLEYAAIWLPTEQAVLGDVTTGAASHLLTKVYLANTEFDKAIASASNVINGPYALMTERFGAMKDDPNRNVNWDLHYYLNKDDPANTEVIYTTVTRPEGPPESWAQTYANRLYTPSYWRVPDSEGQRATNWNTSAGDTLGIGNGDVRSNNFWLYRIWEDDTYQWNTTPDTRRAPINWIEMTGDTAEILTARAESPDFGQPITKSYIGNLRDTLNYWFSWPQYKLYIPTEHVWIPVGGEADWYIFRLAETYLLRAEAYYWKGELELAATDINMVRARSDAPLITAADVTIEYIFDERARELYTEAPRHSEMVRASYILARLARDGYSMDNFGVKNWYYDKVMEDNDHFLEPRYARAGNDIHLDPYNVLWPVPQSIITANTLGRINQNYGYDGYEYNEPPLTTIPEDE